MTSLARTKIRKDEPSPPARYSARSGEPAQAVARCRAVGGCVENSKASESALPTLTGLPIRVYPKPKETHRPGRDSAAWDRRLRQMVKRQRHREAANGPRALPPIRARVTATRAGRND